jgi:hypothetical protein
VIEEINRLKGKKSIGYYDIPVNNFISCKNILAKPLVRLFNMSIDQGKFPSILKVARVLPVYQNDVKHIVNNYRPISILNCISKVLERLMHKRLYIFLHKLEILYLFNLV